MMMYQTNMSNGEPYANWDIESNTNQLVLAYTSTSNTPMKLILVLVPDNLGPRRCLGFTDPRIDAVGYRTLMTLGLAGSFTTTFARSGRSWQPFLHADYS